MNTVMILQVKLITVSKVTFILQQSTSSEAKLMRNLDKSRVKHSSEQREALEPQLRLVKQLSLFKLRIRFKLNILYL